MLLPMAKPTSDILTITEVAERTLYRLAAAKKVPAFKVGGTWRFSRTDIDRWIAQQSMSALDTGRVGDGAAKGQPNNGERK